MSTAHLALYLDAPLQSWGYQSRFDRRTSLSFPTRSGVLGMICAARGIDRTDTEGLAEMNELRISVFAFEQHPRLMDFHTVGGGWDRKTDPMNVVPKAGDKPGRNSGATVVSRREYLQSSKFGVVVEGERSLIEDMAEALRNPTWGIWLGRKSCVPASPVCHGVFDSAEEALNRLRHLSGREPQRHVHEVERFEDGTDTIRDVPVDFAERKFAPRRIAEGAPE